MCHQLWNANPLSSCAQWGRRELHPGDAFGLARLHLHDVRDGVLRPAVVGLQLDGVTPGLFGAAVVAALLLPEGEHAEQEAVSRHVAAPGGHHPGDTPAQVVAVAVVEVRQVPHLQGQHIGRIVVEQAIEPCPHSVPVAGGPVANRGDVHALAVRRGGRQPVQLVQAAPYLGQVSALPHGDADLGPQDVTHDEVRLGRERGVDRGDRVAAVGLQLPEGGFEHREAPLAGGRHGNAAEIFKGEGRHVILPRPAKRASRTNAPEPSRPRRIR